MSTFKNFVQCRVVAPITADADSIGIYDAVPPYSLPSEEGGLLVLTDSPNNPSKLEVISYTSLTDLALYGVTRGLEGTTALDWTGPVYCYQSLLAGEFKTLLDSKVDMVAGKQLSDTNFTQAEKTKLAGIAAGAQANVATNLAQGTRTTTTVIVTSSTGNNATLSAATTTQAGVMTSADKSKLDGIATGAQVNVATNLAQGTRTSTGLPLTSSTGTGTTLPVATTSLAGLMSAADKVTLGGRAGLSVAQTFTARQTFGAGVVEKAVAVAAANIDLSAGSVFSKTITTATSLTVSNVPSNGSLCSFVLELTNPGAAVITWWSGACWAGGTAPELTVVGKDVLGFYTNDGGSNWLGFVLGKDIR